MIRMYGLDYININTSIRDRIDVFSGKTAEGASEVAVEIQQNSAGSLQKKPEKAKERFCSE